MDLAAGGQIASALVALIALAITLMKTRKSEIGKEVQNQIDFHTLEVNNDIALIQKDIGNMTKIFDIKLQSIENTTLETRDLILKHLGENLK